MTVRVAVVTGGRADYGFLAEPMRHLSADPRFDLRVVATGQHIVGDGGRTLRWFADDGFKVDETVDILGDSDTALATCQATGRAVSGIAEALSRLQPDIVLLLGDRYEILAAALAAHLLRVPIAHIAGGDVTEGAIDDSLRHAITKLSHIHFVTNEDSARRVRQLGEDPRTIHVTGSPGLDRIRTVAIPDRETFFREIGVTDRSKNFVVTFQPITVEATSLADVRELLAALDILGADVSLIFTGVNADTDAHVVEQEIRAFCASRSNASYHSALGSRLYFAALAYCDMVVGNSSSGLYEAPSFRIPTVNIGTRQARRLKAASVIDCLAERDAILAAIGQASTLDCTAVVNPYGDGHAAERIVDVLANLTGMQVLLMKSFRDILVE